MKTLTVKQTIIISTITLLMFTLNACKKEESITPNTPTAPTAPTVPTVPVVPAVSVKPTNISTTENGGVIRNQNFVYDAQGNLIKYASKISSGVDSVLIATNSVSFKKNNSNNIIAALTFNTDKTFKSLFSGANQFFFEHNSTQLLSLFKIRNGQSPSIAAQFNYNNNNISVIGAEIRIDINYHANLPYQKGINEIPVLLKPIQFFKAIELSNVNASVLYNKLIRNVILDFGNRKETHDYTYTFDSNNRVTQIAETITNVTTSSSTQRFLTSTITYN